MEPFPLRVLVVDEQPIAREVLIASLERAGLEAIGVADATQAVEVARRSHPDVALVDVHVPGGGVSATEGIVGSVDGCRVLVLATHRDWPAILQMLLAGAEGYVVKGTPIDELLAIVGRAARTEVGLSVDVVAGLMRDLLREIADLSEIRERLHRSEERFRHLLEAAPDAVVIVNGQGEILLVNRQTELMFGYARSDLLGRPMEFLVPERFHVAHIAHRQAYLSAPRTRRMGLAPCLTGRRADGKEFPVDIGLSTLETDEGTIVIAFVRDRSEYGGTVEEVRSHEAAEPADDARQQLTIDLAGVEKKEWTATTGSSTSP